MNQIDTIKTKTFAIEVFDCGEKVMFRGPDSELSVQECAWFCEAVKDFNRKHALTSAGSESFQFMVASSGRGQLWSNKS